MHYENLSALNVLNHAYEYLYGQSLNVDRLMNDLLLDCGVDGAGLIAQDILDAFRNIEGSKWYDVQFACTAALASYSASGECSNIEFVRAVAAMFIISNCINHGDGDWERSFDFMINVIESNKAKSTYIIRMSVLAIILCNRK